MSIHAVIAVKTSTGFSAIYCHVGGGSLILELGAFFSTLEKAQELITLGNILSIDKGIVDAYCRDRGERLSKNAPELCTDHTDLIRTAQEFYRADYLHIFHEDGKSGYWTTTFIG